ncbi:hypothetical protein [Treponema brennaborense]|nr:hypothetical protein [Treponema brennaborense]
MQNGGIDMSGSQILIKGGTNWFEFSKSQTGQLDYLGKIQSPVSIKGYQKIASSTYFSPSYYIFLQEEMNTVPEIYVSPSTDISDRDTYEFLLHIGALLCAVESKNSALAGDLYWRRKSSFEKCTLLTQFIIQPLAAEILFSLMFGRFNNVSEKDIPLIFNEARKQLGIDLSKETIEQAFVRYFKENKVTLTLPVVGTNYHSWTYCSAILDSLSENIKAEDFAAQLKNIKSAKYELYAGLETAVQAEPYNPVDENAIAVMIENIDSKLAGNSGLEKAGYIRAMAAKIIRAAKPEKISYEGKIAQLSEKEIVITLTI